MVLTSTGEVVTNHHVVEGATTVRVTVMSTGASYRATVVGTDAKDDVAVLQLQDASGLQTVTPDTDGTSVGDAVTAVGDAGGDTSTFTAAAGKIMAEDQSITTRSEPGHPGEKLRGLIKISSDVISGDSGGATYDDEGEVIGMTTAASSGTSDVVGYAIPIAQVVSIAGDLENGTQNTRYEYGSPAFLGLGLGNTGTRVAAVYPGTPAAARRSRCRRHDHRDRHDPRPHLDAATERRSGLLPRRQRPDQLDRPRRDLPHRLGDPDRRPDRMIPDLDV